MYVFLILLDPCYLVFVSALWRNSYFFQFLHIVLVRESSSLVSLFRALGDLTHFDCRKTCCLGPWTEIPVSCLWAGNLVKWVHVWVNSWVHMDWPHIVIHWSQSDSWFPECGPHASFHRCQPSTETSLEPVPIVASLAPSSLRQAQSLRPWDCPVLGLSLHLGS